VNFTFPSPTSVVQSMPSLVATLQCTSNLNDPNCQSIPKPSLNSTSMKRQSPQRTRLKNHTSKATLATNRGSLHCGVDTNSGTRFPQTHARNRAGRGKARNILVESRNCRYFATTSLLFAKQLPAMRIQDKLKGYSGRKEVAIRFLVVRCDLHAHWTY
jgi:hypothetical protein